MPRKKRQEKKRGGSGKVGSDPQAIRQFGGKGDFGAPAGDQDTRERDYVSHNTKASDRGAAQPASEEFDELRTHGAGGKVSGTGSSSGGDLDTDIIGVGTGGSGIAASPPSSRPPGADQSDGSTRENASGPPAAGKNQPEPGQVGGPRPVLRSIAKANADAGEPGGADSANKPQEGADDASAGEVSSDEASGQNDRR